MDYQKLSANHWQHHRYPGEDRDPDFYDANGLVWYYHFMKGYLDLKQTLVQMLGLGTIFIVLYFGYHAPLINLWLFWVLPIFASTVQLFFFGTYLPHHATPFPL